jgi:hypothetical protein
MQVRVGDKITRGQVVAKCGNSGNSTVPHLHFQLTDGPLVSHSASLPAYFSGVLKDGAQQASVLPLSGDRLTQNPPKTATDKPRSDKSHADKPAADKPRSDKPHADKPPSDKPPSDKPAADKPTADKPPSDKPRTDAGGS